MTRSDSDIIILWYYGWHYSKKRVRFSLTNKVFVSILKLLLSNLYRDAECACSKRIKERIKRIKDPSLN